VQLRAQRQNVLSGLFLHAAARLGLDLQLVLAAGCDLALELELVALLALGGLVLPVDDLPAVPRRDERPDQRCPQARDDAQPHQLEVVAQHQHAGGPDREHGGCNK
jgi:hypothetical protein